MDNNFPVLDGYRIFPCPDLGVDKGQASRNFELPTVPRASQDGSLTAVLKYPPGRRHCRAGYRPKTQWAPGVGTSVVQGVETASDVKEADALPIEVEDHPFADRQVAGSARDVLLLHLAFGHPNFLARSANDPHL